MLDLFSKLSVAIATVGLGAAVFTTSQAQASIITYDFTVNVTQGSLDGLECWISVQALKTIQQPEQVL